MFEKFEKKQLDYEIGECQTRDDTIFKTVTSKKHGDKFIVTGAWECFHSPDAPKIGSYASACKQCWNQVYSGLLCIHCLVVLADKVTRTKHLRDKVSICRKAIKACHRHWHRGSYEEVPGSDKYDNLPNSEKIFARVIADQLKVRDNRLPTPMLNVEGPCDSDASRVLDVTPVSRPVSRSSRGSRVPPEARFSRGSRTSRESRLSRVSRETFMNYVARVTWSVSAACRRRTAAMHSSGFSSASSSCNVNLSTTMRTSRSSSCFRGIESPMDHPSATWSGGPYGVPASSCSSSYASSSSVHHKRVSRASSADDLNNSAAATSGRIVTGGRKFGLRRKLFPKSFLARACKDGNQSFTLSELDHVEFRNPDVRETARERKHNNKKKNNKHNRNRRKRKPNTGSQETEADKEEIPARMRKKSASKKSASINHQRIHDDAVGRVIRPIMNPREKDFSAKELISMIKHLGLTIPDTGVRKRVNKKDRFQCWLRYYNANLQYRRECFTLSRVVCLGTHVAKYFGTDIYSGTLKSKMKDETGIIYWRVSYFDGDEEDLNNLDVQSAIKLHESLQDQKRMNEFMD